MRSLLERLLCLLAGLCTAPLAAAAGFAFAVVGDAPYFGFEEGPFQHLLQQLGEEQLAFVVHVGDFKSSTTPCDDALFEQRRAQFDASPLPLFYTPGDNEWTDCRPLGKFDPNERLDRLRQLFYSESRSLGQRKRALTRQADLVAYGLPENLLWREAGVLFVTLHVVGSHNGLVPPVDRHFEARERANQAWLAHAFREARRSKAPGVVLIMQADPQLEAEPGGNARRGFDAVLGQLQKELNRSDKPVLLIHGDGHRYRVDRPWPKLQRLESFGSPFLHWVRVRVDPSGAELFQIEPGPSSWGEGP